MRRSFILWAALAVLGCDLGEPELYPEIAGTYDYTANVENGPAGYYQGVLLITQRSRELPDFDGTVQIQWFGSMPQGADWSDSGPMLDERLTRSGQIEFELAVFSTWRHVGTFANGRIEGTWIRSQTNQHGSFIAVRRGS